MIGPLHNDIWGVVVNASGDDVTACLSRVCTQLRRIVYDHYVDLIGPNVGGMYRFKYSDWHISVHTVHYHGIYDVYCTHRPHTLQSVNFDVEYCANCIETQHINKLAPTTPFSPAILKIAIGMTQLFTTWRINWPEK